MPLATIHLFALQDSAQLYNLLSHIKSAPVTPLVLSKPVRWIITPEKIQAKELLTPEWDLLLIVLDERTSRLLIKQITSPSKHSAYRIIAHWHSTAGVPSRLTSAFDKTNAKLLHPDPSTIPALTGSLSNKQTVQDSSQDLGLSPDLRKWTESFSKTRAGGNSMSMLNLLAFKPDLKPSYLEYGKAFATSIGKRRGGYAKLVGNIVPDADASPSASSANKQSSGNSEGLKWDEFALAHYPSITHFADMLASEDYQEVNKRSRLPSLKDTCILCTSEIEVEDLLAAGKSKL